MINFYLRGIGNADSGGEDSDDLTRFYLRKENASAETLGGERRHVCCASSRVSRRSEGSDESRGVKRGG